MQSNFIETTSFENEEIIVYEENNVVIVDYFNIFDTLNDEDKTFIENMMKEIGLHN